MDLINMHPRTFGQTQSVTAQVALPSRHGHGPHHDKPTPRYEYDDGARSRGGESGCEKSRTIGTEYCSYDSCSTFRSTL